MLVVDGTPRRPLLAAPHEVAWLDDAVAPAVHRDVDGSRYGFYRLEQEAMQLADTWAVAAVERLQRARLLRPYEGVDLAPIMACWLYYRDLLCREGGGDSRLAVFETPPALITRGLDELLRGLGACREAWQALQGNVSPRLTVEVLLGRLAVGSRERGSHARA